MIAVIAMGIVGCGEQQTDITHISDHDSTGSAVGKVTFDADSPLSEADATLLAKVTQKLKQSCANNKYRLSEAECIQTIDERQNLCTQQTAGKFPNQLGDTDKMQAIVTSHLACLFAKK